MCAKFFKSFTIISTILISLCSVSKADGITVSGGRFDHNDSRARDMVQIDYDFDKILFGSPIGDFKPVIGFLRTGGDAKYGYAGVRLDYKVLNNSILISPSFTPGIYGKGDGKDLGHGLEFKSQVRVALNLTPTFNIGVAYSHISNASLGEKNPGANNYTLGFQKNF
jgi:lipid A 3-O-deacylase